MELLELHKNFVDELLQCINGDWDKIELQFEYFPWKGDYFESFIAKYYDNAVKHQFSLSLEASDILLEIHKKMGEEGKDEWTWLKFTLDNTGKYNFEFFYDMPPIAKNILEKSGELK